MNAQRFYIQARRSTISQSLQSLLEARNVLNWFQLERTRMTLSRTDGLTTWLEDAISMRLILCSTILKVFKVFCVSVCYLLCY